jgi:hypothetical protein
MPDAFGVVKKEENKLPIVEPRKYENKKPWWKPKQGVYNVIVTKIGNVYPNKFDPKKDTIRIEAAIEKITSGSVKFPTEEFSWSMDVSSVDSSIYGQLSRLMEANLLMNQEITLIVKESTYVKNGEEKTRRDFTVLQAMMME